MISNIVLRITLHKGRQKLTEKVKGYLDNTKWFP